MTLNDMAPWADMLAATGVIVSLCILAYELHQSRKQAELTNWRELLQGLVDYKGLLHDPVLADVVLRGQQDLDSLTPAERLSFEMYLEQAVHLYGNFLKHNDSLPRKLVGLDEAVGNMFVEALTSPGGARWWRESRARSRFMPGTYETVDAILRAGRKSTAPPMPRFPDKDD